MGAGAGCNCERVSGAGSCRFGGVAPLQDNSTALAWRDFGEWRSVYAGGIQLRDEFLNALARHAGVWVAAEPGDAVFANQDFLTIHALHTSEKTLVFARPSTVIDLATGAMVAETAASLRVRMKGGETRWFRLRAGQP